MKLGQRFQSDSTESLETIIALFGFREELKASREVTGGGKMTLGRSLPRVSAARESDLRSHRHCKTIF